MNNDEAELNRLYFENILWVIFIGLAILNIFGDMQDIDYLKYHKLSSKKNANRIFEITITSTFFIYIYFLTRNYNQLKKAREESKNLYLIKLAGSIFLIIGILCLLYFQRKQNDFIGSPAI